MSVCDDCKFNIIKNTCSCELFHTQAFTMDGVRSRIFSCPDFVNKYLYVQSNNHAFLDVV